MISSHCNFTFKYLCGLKASITFKNPVGYKKKYFNIILRQEKAMDAVWIIKVYYLLSIVK